MGKTKKAVAAPVEQEPPVDFKVEAVRQTDMAVREIELRYGPGRLLAACPDLALAEKMRRQMQLYNDAVYGGSAADTQVQAQGLIKGYQALERAFLEAGGQPLDHAKVIETELDNGSVLAIVPDITQYSPRPGETREVLAIGAGTVAEMFDKRTRETLAAVSRHWPGAHIESAKRKPLEDEIPF